MAVELAVIRFVTCLDIRNLHVADAGHVGRNLLFKIALHAKHKRTMPSALLHDGIFSQSEPNNVGHFHKGAALCAPLNDLAGDDFDLVQLLGKMP